MIRPRTVIILDIDEYVCYKISHWFQSIGWQTMIFHDGLEVWNQLQTMLPIMPDCIITEIFVSNMNAYELARNCATNLQLKDVNLIFYSVKDSDFDHHWACTGGLARAYVSKTNGKITIRSRQLRYVGDGPDESITKLIDEFHAMTDNQESKPEVMRQLIDYSFPILLGVIHDLGIVDGPFR